MDSHTPQTQRGFQADCCQGGKKKVAKLHPLILLSQTTTQLLIMTRLMTGVQ